MGEKEALDAQKAENDLTKALLSKARRGRIKKWIKRIIIVGVIAYIAFAIKTDPKNRQVVEEFPYEEMKAEYGEVLVEVEGDGVISAKSTYSIVPKVTGEILEDHVALNEYVEKGDVLYVIDTKDINSTLNQVGLAVEQSNISLQQSKLNVNTIQKQIDDLKIYASGSGYVSNLRLAEGSLVSSMTPVCEVKQRDLYEVKLPFMTSSVQDMSIGNKASVFFLDYLTSMDGVVSEISDSTSLTGGGAQVTNVTIQVEAPGYSVQTARVKGTIFTNIGSAIESTQEGYITDITASVVVSNGTGTVKKLYIENGSYVNQGDLIAELENTNLDTQLENAKASVKTAEIAVRNAQNSKSATQTQLDNYYITAPISGKVIYINSKKGDVISTYQQTNSNVMAVLADVSTLKFEVQIDEMDISKIKIGQEVEVMVEALNNQVFSGEVVNINTLGVNVGGTTNYSVLIEFPGVNEIYSGMTADAKIKVAQKDNTLRVPLTAVRKGEVVYKKSESGEYQDEDTSVPKGYEKVKVELGLNSDEYVEILSGIQKDDIVLVDKIKESGKFDMDSLRTMMMEN